MTNRNLNHSSDPGHKKFNTTSSTSQFVEKSKMNRSRLPVLNLTTFYQSKSANKSQSTTVLHFPLKKQPIDETEKVVPIRTKKRFSILDQMGEQIFNLRFTSFMQIGEQNHSLVNSKEDNKIVNQLSKTKIEPQLPNHNSESSLNDSQDVGMELHHNQMVFKHLSEYQRSDHETQLRALNNQIAKNEREQKMQLLIRQFPTIVKNKVGSLHQFASPPDKLGLGSTTTINIKTRKHSLKGTKENAQSYFFGKPIGFWYKQEENTNYKPEFREMASSSSLGRKAYIYGGIGMHVLGDLLEIDLATFQAKKLSQIGDKPQNRYAGALHALTYPIQIQTTYTSVKALQGQQPAGRTLILFAGESSFNSQMKQRECLCDCRVYNIDTGDWKYLRPNSDFNPEARRSFGSCIIGKGLLVHAGQTNRSNYLRDLYYLNLNQCKWVQVETSNEIYPNGIAFHQMLPLYNKPQNVTVGGMFQEKNQSLGPKKFKLEGVYSFGGCYQDKLKFAQFDLPFVSILLLHQFLPTWSVPETTGKCPEARTFHSVTYIQQSNTVAVFGGRNDLIDKPYMSDMHLLQMETLEWLTVRQVGELCQPRGGHCTFSNGTQLLVLGGLNLKGYLSSQLERCEMDRGIVRQLNEQYQLKQRFGNSVMEMQQEVVTHESSEPDSMIQVKKPKMSMYMSDADIMIKALEAQSLSRLEQKKKIEYLKYSNFNYYVPEQKEKLLTKYQSFKTFKSSNHSILKEVKEASPKK